MTVHINEFNSTLFILVLVDIEFNDEVNALFLLTFLLECWYSTVISTNSSSETIEHTFEGIYKLIPI